MISVLIATHGKMAAGLSDSIYLIMGEQVQFATIGLHEENNVMDFKADLYDQVVELDSGDGVLVLTDLMGGSPYNSVIMSMKKFSENGHQVRLLSGVNLPMVLEVLVQRLGTNDLKKVYLAALESGVKGIRESIECAGRSPV